MDFLGSTVLWPYIQYVRWCCCYVGPVCMQCHIEQYNKLLVNCAFVGTLHK